jgi:hypothetical protein
VGEHSVVCHSDRFVHGGQVFAVMCVQCPHANDPRAESRGLGDTVHKVTHALGIPECGGCKQRLELLNQLVQY